MTEELRIMDRGCAFGTAIEHVRNGGRAQRAGWNGKGMWIAYGKGGMTAEKDFWNPHTKAHALRMGGQVEVLPYLILKTADDKILMGWLASQTDMLARDWQLLAPIVNWEGRT